MKSAIFNLLAGASLLLCSGIAYMWIASAHSLEHYYYVNWFGVQRTNFKSVSLNAFGGKLYLSWGQSIWSDDLAAILQHETPDGFHHESFDARRNNITLNNWRLVMPLWTATVLSAILPFIWIVRFRQFRQRTHLGLCEKCGYDLRATPDRCPECGNVRIRINAEATE